MCYPVNALHGKISKHVNFYYTVRNGNQYQVVIPPWEDKPTAAQLSVREATRETNQRVSAVLSNPARRAMAEAELLTLKHAALCPPHTRLRDYLWKKMYVKAEPACNSHSSSLTPPTIPEQRSCST